MGDHIDSKELHRRQALYREKLSEQPAQGVRTERYGWFHDTVSQDFKLIDYTRSPESNPAVAVFWEQHEVEAVTVALNAAALQPQQESE